MKKLLRLTFGTLVVAASLAMTPPAYARGGHSCGHGNIALAMVGTVAGKPRPPMLRADIYGFGFRGGRGHARHAGRAYYATRGGNWGGWGSYNGYPVLWLFPL